MHFAFVRHEPAQHAPEPQRFLAQRRTHPVVAGGGRIAFVENQIDHLQHRGEPRRTRIRLRHLEWHLGRGQRALGPHDALRDGRLGHEERARDFVRGEAAQQTQRQRDACVGGQHRVARREHQPQQVVADIVGARGIEAIDEIRHEVRLQCVEIVAQLFALAGMQRFLAQAVEGAVLRGRHQPRSRIVGHARVGPMFERRHQRVLRQLFGEPHVAHDPCDVGDDLGGFDPPDCLDGTMGGRLRHGISPLPWRSGPCRSAPRCGRRYPRSRART